MKITKSFRNIRSHRVHAKLQGPVNQKGSAFELRFKYLPLLPPVNWGRLCQFGYEMSSAPYLTRKIPDICINFLTK